MTGLKRVMFAPCVLLAACGGGGGGGAGGTPTPTVSTLNVTLTSTSTSATVTEGARTNLGFTASYTGTPSGAVVPDVQVNGSRIALAGAPTANGVSAYDVKLVSADFLPGGQTANQVTFRLCTDSNCSTVYPGSTQTFTVNLTVNLKDWQTVQRDAAHTGYVGVKYATSAFGTAPLWSVPKDAVRPSAIAARAGTVYANFIQQAQNGGRVTTRAIASDTGAVRWNYDLGQTGFNTSAPSYDKGRVVSAAIDISASSIPMPVLDATDGHALKVLSYASQFAKGGAPVPFADKLYHQAGYYGNVVYAFDPAAGTTDWVSDQSRSGGVWEGESVAVDAQYVYFYRADALIVLNRLSGALVSKIADPFFSREGLSYSGTYAGAPVLDGAGRIFTFSDNRYQNQPAPLIAFAIGQPTYLWRTNVSYINQPALRGGRLYAPRADSTFVDVIDTASGSVVASMNVGTGKPNLTSNVIVTESHIFVGSDSETYAIDLNAAGNPVVWTAAQGGDLAITPDNLLVISGNSGLSAYKLN